MSDIVCALTGRHFNSIEAARECAKHCQNCHDNQKWQEELHWLPKSKTEKSPNSRTNTSSKEWKATLKTLYTPQARASARIPKPAPKSQDATNSLTSPFDPNRVGYYIGERPRKAKAGGLPWLLLLILTVVLLLVILYLLHNQKSLLTLTSTMPSSL